MKKVIILGAGVTGLRIGTYLADAGYKVTILEKNPLIGGASGSFNYKDFILDYGPHKFYSQIPEAELDFKNIIGDGNYIKVRKKNSIRLLGKYFDFPIKMSQLLTGISPKIAVNILKDLFKTKLDNKKEIKSYEDYFIKGFGKTGYSILFKGFAEKVWGNPKNLSEELARKRSPASSVFDVLKTAIIKNDKNVNAKFFYYPKKGFSVICNNLASSIVKKGGRIITNISVDRLILKNNKVSEIDFYHNKKRKNLSCDIIVSTIPINEISLIISPRPKKEILDASKGLRFRSLIIAYIFLKKEKAINQNWIFFPEKEFCFNRIAELKSFSPLLGPKSKTVLTAELTCDTNDQVYSLPEEKLKDNIIKDLEKVGLIKKEEIYDFLIKKKSKAYPIYDMGYKQNLNKILKYLDSIQNFYTTGRPGLFNYNNADHCLDMAKLTSEIIKNEGSRSAWEKARAYFENYRIVD